jgi:hypothetical protein
MLLCAVFVLSSAVAFAEEQRNVNDLLNEFKADASAAKANYRGKKITFEIEVEKRVTEGGKTYYQAVAGNAAKNARVLFRLAKTYRATDKLVVTATLKGVTWQADQKVLFFDPAEVDKELRLLPPFYTSSDLLKKYEGAPQKTADEMVGKSIDIKGVVRFVKGTGVVLEFTPLTDAKGRVTTDKQGFEKLGRALVTVNFSDGSVKKASLARGVEIEARGVVDTMQSGAITLRDAHLLTK